MPDPAACALALARTDQEAVTWVLEEDFVPLPGCTGEARGEPAFVGFGIRGARDRWDDYRGLKLRGKIAVILEGEPRHRKLFEGPEVTEASDVFGKLQELQSEGVAGVLVVRRSPAAEVEGPDGEPLPPARIGYRHTWAHWNPIGGTTPWRQRGESWDLPVVEVSEAVASAVLGTDVAALAEKMDRSGKPARFEVEDGGDREVHLATGFTSTAMHVDNVVGLLPGSDPAVAGEHIVLGAHYDHIGVDPWGRIAFGADDNASGTAALIELAEALALAQPRRSILFAAFAAEEDGLIGARAFCDYPPVPLEQVIAMLNMDMLGIGKTREVVVLGTKQNPDLEEVLERAEKLAKTGLKKVVTGKAADLWERSDHFAFHEKGIPSLFFHETVKESDNPDYHTYRDTIDKLDIDKIANATRLVFNTTWILCEEEEKPAPPR